MAGKTAKKARLGTGTLTRLIILVLLAAIGWQLYSLRGQIGEAEAEKSRLESQVSEKQRENASLEADIAEGPTNEKLEEIARDELGYVKPGEYVFETSN